MNSNGLGTGKFQRAWIAVLAAVLALLGVAAIILSSYQPARAAGELTVEILAPYNLVVDSNVTAPSTYAPSVATVAGRFCNTTGSTIHNVTVYIGDYNGSSSTPGVYPARDSSAGGFLPASMANTGIYRLSHLGGSLGTLDAARFVGDLAPGQCTVQYWHFTYPQCSNTPPGWTPNPPPCEGSTVPVWGNSNDPNDDLWLTLDMWATSTEGYGDNASWTVHMRNEISAMANKIQPNPDGRWFNTDDDTVLPGEIVTTNGILYELGNIRQGFDNNGDYVPDYNAWLQPIGVLGYDPSCFRLVETSGVLTVTRSGGNPTMVIPFHNKLYFTSLPPDNTGVRGEVYYKFLALGGPCSATLSPYQEVASGYDNEKFNGDYGTGIPGIRSLQPNFTIDKSSAPNQVAPGGTINYSIVFQNTGTSGLGLISYQMPLAIYDSIPANTTYVGGSAGISCGGGETATILYSTNNRQTWTATMPSPSSITDLQWRLNTQLGAGHSCTASFQVTVNNPYGGPTPIITNEACGTLGGGNPLVCDKATNLVSGNNSIGDFVWRDENGNALQDDGAGTGIANIAVKLYYDANNNGVLDPTDILVFTQDTNSSGGYVFNNLPNGRFIVQVDSLDSDLPTGYSTTTPKTLAFNLTGGTAITTADFGFGPALKVQKNLVSRNPAYEGDIVTWNIRLTNTRPGDGTPNGFCTHNIWATIAHPTTGAIPPGGGPANSQWQNPNGALNAPDNNAAYTVMNDNTDLLGLSGFNLGAQSGTITSVKFLIYAREIAEFKSTDSFIVRVYYSDAQIGSDYTYTGAGYFTSPAGTDYLISQDITSLRAWTWSDFVNNLTEMQIEGNKGSGGGASGDISVDAVAYVITTNQQCADAADTISYLPLTDTFDPARLQFLSANPTQSSVGSGTITWNDLGPLYPGQTKIVTVTFRALQPATEAPVTTTNTATVTNPRFADGRLANNGTSSANVTINPTGSIGDLIFYDVDGNNAYTPGVDRGIPNVRVRLCNTSNCNGTIYATTFTDQNGAYLFPGLLDGTSYYVVVDTSTLPGGATGWTNNVDPDGGGNSLSGPLTINNTDGNPANNDRLDQDFGYRRTTNGIIFGSVWEDDAGNGQRDPSDGPFPAPPGVTVWLCAATDPNCTTPVATTTTNANGQYFFTGVTPGNYYVRVNTASLPAINGTWSNTFDPEGDNNSRTNTITVVNGGFYGSYDFGYYRTGTLSIGDTLYRDWNGNGTQNTGEEGIPNVTVYLYRDENGNGVIDPEDTQIAVTSTDSNGYYTFNNLAGSASGTRYLVVVDRTDPDYPSGTIQTQDPDQGGVCTTCDDKASVTLVNSSVNTIDFGYKPQGGASIGDMVWKDMDGDGVQDADEVGIANITVNLYEDSDGDGVLTSADALVATTTTDANGYYDFKRLAAGRYLVDIDTNDTDLPTDALGYRYRLTTNNDPKLVVLAANQDYNDADFGFAPPGLIGDFVWQDNNGDGHQDVNEIGINGVSVTLYVWNDDGDGIYEVGERGAVLATTTTVNGAYAFPNLSSGKYIVGVTPPVGYDPTYERDAYDVPCATSGTGACDQETPVILRFGQTDRSVDFGFRAPGNIGDTLWIDSNGNGVRDPGEAGIPNITVELWDCGAGTCNDGDETLYSSTSTNGDGYYSFGNVPDDTYQVRVITSDPDFPSGLIQTYDPDETNPCTGCDSRGQVTVSGGGDYYNLDFGYRYYTTTNPNSISGTVFYDVDNDAFQDPGETTTYSGVTIYLWRGNTLIGSTITDANGDYSFTNLPNGTYTVSVNPDAPNLDGLSPTNTSSPTTYRTVNLTGNTNAVDQDFGFLSSLDFGDLPAPYNLTTLAHDGARHLVPATGQVYFGTSVDTEPNGLTEYNSQPSMADADDRAGSDDEDGIVQTPGYNWTMGANGGHVNITVSGCPSTCYVSAWINWNGDPNGNLVGDMDFNDPYERILVDYPVTNGLNSNITFYVPENPASQTYYVRFRLYTSSTNGFATPNGLVINGETEDYRWQFGVTAVEMISLDATVQPGGLPLWGWLAATILLGSGAFVLRRLWRKRA